MQELPPNNTRVIVCCPGWNKRKIRGWEAEVRIDILGRPGRRWVLYDFAGRERAYPKIEWQPESWRFKDES